MRTFEIGKIYTHGYIGDSQLFSSYIVIKRTAATITIQGQDDGQIRTCRINKGLSEFVKAEAVYPDGCYSKAPILTA